MKNKLVNINDGFKLIDKNYFDNYGGGDYSKTYLGYTTNPLIIINDLYDNEVYFETLLDAGCASGEMVKDFRELGIKAYGIENNKDALKNCIVPEYCSFMDIRDMASISKGSFDIVYCNSLMYLFPQEIIPILKEFKRISKKAVYLCNPFLGETLETNDVYRVFLATRKWWNKQFSEAGFTKLTDNIYLP